MRGKKFVYWEKLHRKSLVDKILNKQSIVESSIDLVHTHSSLDQIFVINGPEDVALFFPQAVDELENLFQLIKNSTIIIHFPFFKIDNLKVDKFKSG